MFYAESASSYKEEMDERKCDEGQEYSTQLFILECIGSGSFITRYDQDVNGNAVNPTIINPADLITLLRETHSIESDGVKLMDSRLLVDDGVTKVWTYTPKADQEFYYNHQGKGMILNLKKWCSFIFKLKEGSLYIGALQHASKPKLNTKVYHAPLPNVYEDGSICLGNVSLPKQFDIDSVSLAYFNSNKTHLNFFGGFRKVKSLENKQYRQWLITKKKEPIRVSELNVLGTVEEFIAG